MNFHQKSYTNNPVLYVWFVCLGMHAASYLIPDLGDISFYGVSLLVSFFIFGFVNNVTGLWQVAPILWIEFAAMNVYFWAGIDGEYKDIGFWYENLETMIGITNSLELMLLMSMVPWRDAWRKLTTNRGADRMAASYGQMSVRGNRQGYSSIPGKEIK